MNATKLVGIALLCAAAAYAADAVTPLDVKVGLWETKVSTDMGGMPKMSSMPSIPPEALAKMPAEQRAKMEAMMKSRAGGGPMNTTTKVCITKEQLSNPAAFSRPDKSCAYKMVSSTSSKQQVHVECDREGVKTTGDLTVERVDAQHIKGNMAMKSGTAEHPVNMNMSFENSWISADCGDVKPPSMK